VHLTAVAKRALAEALQGVVLRRDQDAADVEVRAAAAVLRVHGCDRTCVRGSEWASTHRLLPATAACCCRCLLCQGVLATGADRCRAHAGAGAQQL
jgi:hypothetical protein